MNCKIIGYDLKSLQVELSPGEQFFCEKGAIIYYEEGIDKEILMLNNGIGGMLKKVISGESVVTLRLYNRSRDNKKLMVAGKLGLLPIDLKKHGGSIICRPGFYVSSTSNIDIDFKLSIESLIGGTGATLQKIKGDSTVFLDSIGSPFQIDLNYGDSIFVDEKSFICVSGSMENNIQAHISSRNVISGEGLNMYKINGPGTVFLNSVNF